MASCSAHADCAARLPACAGYANEATFGQENLGSAGKLTERTRRYLVQAGEVRESVGLTGVVPIC